MSRRPARAAALAAALATGTAGGAEPWEHIWFRVPVEADGSIRTGQVLERAHLICQALGGRHYQSGSSRLGRRLYTSGTKEHEVREMRAACTADGEQL